MATNRLRLPAAIIAYVMESFAPITHGHYMKRLPPINVVIGGNKYDFFPSSSENAIIGIIAYADSERNLYYDRLRNAKEQHSKAHGKLASRKKALLDASQAADRLSGPRKARAEGAKIQFESEVLIAEREVERLQAIIAEVDQFLIKWEPQESMHIRADDWSKGVFVLSQDDAPIAETETPLESVKCRLKEGDQHAATEIRMVMPPEELSLDQVERFLLDQDKTNRSRVSFIIQKIAEGRKNATERGPMPVVQPEGPVAGGNDQGLGAGDGVPVLQGATAPASEPVKLQADAGKSDRRKRS